MDTERIAKVIFCELPRADCTTCHYSEDGNPCELRGKCHIRKMEWALSMDEARRIAELIASKMEEEPCRKR